MKKLTYEEKINQLIDEIDNIYEQCGSLRDYATESEKEHWNKMRGIFYAANKPLFALRDTLSLNRREMKTHFKSKL